MKVLQNIQGRLSKSSSCSFIPVHTHIQTNARPRTRSSVTIWNLPEEILIHLLKNLHIKDLLNMRAVHPRFRDLIDTFTSLWTVVRFHDCWPSLKNIHHFQRAADNGNVEALVKLAVAYLYNEGLPGELDTRNIIENGTNAAKMFCQIETITPNTVPFTWLFFRPPWSTSGACCKECVFTYMKQHLETNANSDIAVCVAKTVELLDCPERHNEIVQYLQLGASLGSGEAAYLHWKHQYSNVNADKAMLLESIRRLRDVTSMGCMDAKLCLAKFYACGKYGDISSTQAAQFLRSVFQTSTPSGIHIVFNSVRDPTPSMRYILVDWLVEVAGMKEFSTLTLHCAVSLVDRFLKVHVVPRSKLQLLGVAAMVICSRFLGKDIITIREAAWLTDNTYKYEDVVRMMGEITATLRGHIRVPAGLDYVGIVNTLASSDVRTVVLSEYICELCLLQAEMGQYSPTEIAASSVLLARLLMKNKFPWPANMEEFTGFSLEDISRCSFHIHEKCFLEGSVVDHRDITLQAVKQRYADEKFYKVSEIEIMSYEELCRMLGVTEHLLHGFDVKLRFRNADELIVSPSRGKSRNQRTIKRCVEREKAATPTVERCSFSDDVIMSGYEGDLEEDEDSFMDNTDSGNSTSESSDVTFDSDSDTYSACLSSFCQGGSSGIRVSYGSFTSAWSRDSNSRLSASCACDLSSSGVSSFSSSSQHSASKHLKSSLSNGQCSGSDVDMPGPSSQTYVHPRRKSLRSVTKMTSPNALRRKNRRSSRTLSCSLLGL